MKSLGLGWELGLWLVKVRVRLAIVCNSTPETTRVPCLIHWIGICFCMRLAFNCCFWSCNKCGWHRHQCTSRTLSVGQGAPQLTFYAFSRFLWCWVKVNTEHNQSVMYVSVKFTETCKNVLIRISYVRRHLDFTLYMLTTWHWSWSHNVWYTWVCVYVDIRTLLVAQCSARLVVHPCTERRASEIFVVTG